MVCLSMRHIVPGALMLVSLAGSALAQIETMPSQQRLPEVRITPPPITRQPGEIPGLPSHLPGPQGNAREIPLPEIFRGCWSGSVPRVDSMQPFSPDMGRLIWLTKTYT
ncbi:MAG: hypothetical protein JO071_11135, partial [Deltaproteobacteria bacterium]|nr:hypothetical protein [Deltaproteobacteria bacterium]